ncbi:MAG: hypothetical protein H6713_14640 [Myxococcales bacterium]|nr:hypothetical protein [Myxococcales bacterium]
MQPDARVPELLVEQLALGVLPPPVARDVSERLTRAGVDVEERLRALRAENDELLRRHPPARARQVIERRLEAARRSRRRRLTWAFAPALAVATAALLWLRVEPDAARGPAVATTTAEPGDASTRRRDALELVAGSSAAEDTRIKGMTPRLIVHRKRGDSVERLAEGSVAREGDRVQLSYLAAGRRQGVIVSYDGRGVVTLHYPNVARASAELRAGGAVPLDHSFELDDAPLFERFVFVTLPPSDASGALEVSRVLEAARAVAARAPQARPSPLPLPSGWEQSVFELVKPRR